ncbi:ferroxidase fet3 [Coemansia javaensis]|uniref:Ferroxidase fet3 n=1 Tax=Coemansia javaensis TaxID=2761396 RepID=A0A9W8LL45_9FUNG|nr:ferroxidase fet3 [Coemansia javaensis]
MAPAVCRAERVELEWDIGYVQVNRDGYNSRRAIGVNGALPIPPVYVTHGDVLAIKVHNSLDVPTAIHAHGLFQNGTSYYDGAGMVTQCGIPPGANFTYELAANQVGTFWIHGHYRHQNSDGLRTPLVIRPPPSSGPADYDEDILLSLEDWYVQESQDKIAEVTAPNAPFPPKATFPYALINGYNGNDTKPIRFTPGRRYRFRLISMSITEWFKFRIPGHVLEVIETDGIRSRPHAVEGIDIGPGQRYSAIVRAHDTDAFNYMYNVTLYANFVPTARGMNPRYYQGLIEYRAGAPVKQVAAAASDDEVRWLDDVELQPADPQPALPVDRAIELTSRELITTDSRSLRTLNKYTYDEPQVPTLVTALTTGGMASDPQVYGPQAEAHVLRHLEGVEVRLNNPMGFVHAFHLHGHAFQIIEYGPVDRSTIAITASGNRTANDVALPPLRRFRGAPMMRDTLVVAPYEYVKLRFRADNPGVWMFHCHMDTHFAAGLAITFVEAPDVLQQRQALPAALADMCARQGIPASGNAVGKAGLDLDGLRPVPQEKPKGDNGNGNSNNGNKGGKN